MLHPLITVFIPIYNAVSFIDSTIGSILNQDYPHFELLLIDDGSQDGSYEKALQWAQRDTRIRLLRNDKNRGESYTANRAIYGANGQYLFRLDADDVALPNRLSTQLPLLQNIMVVGSAIHVIDQDSLTYVSLPTTDEQIKAHFFMCANNIANPSSAFNLDFVRKNQIRYREDWLVAGDLHFWVDCMVAGASFANVSEPLIYYRIHANQASKNMERLILAQTQIRQKLLSLWYPDLSPQQVQCVLLLFGSRGIMYQEIMRGIDVLHLLVQNTESRYGEDRRYLIPYFQMVEHKWCEEIGVKNKIVK